MIGMTRELRFLPGSPRHSINTGLMIARRKKDKRYLYAVWQTCSGNGFRTVGFMQCLTLARNHNSINIYS